ncbi:hypothetical protein I7I53_01370 [Histoplasma capsulatum var. duboisii H88]|uniref:Uncharacterized protein n=1 Tax=Ajellomyces capsulatus (strain H88) TaxID=544711 RepID=A0A8A1LKG0_AJEC8|nr:hypothetical protein I7I53_01370 [Histoplasma capsulatum var. duboisii H88]
MGHAQGNHSYGPAIADAALLHFISVSIQFHAFIFRLLQVIPCKRQKINSRVRYVVCARMDGASALSQTRALGRSTMAANGNGEDIAYAGDAHPVLAIGLQDKGPSSLKQRPGLLGRGHRYKTWYSLVFRSRRIWQFGIDEVRATTFKFEHSLYMFWKGSVLKISEKFWIKLDSKNWRRFEDENRGDDKRRYLYSFLPQPSLLYSPFSLYTAVSFQKTQNAKVDEVNKRPSTSVCFLRRLIRGRQGEIRS